MRIHWAERRNHNNLCGKKGGGLGREGKGPFPRFCSFLPSPPLFAPATQARTITFFHHKLSSWVHPDNFSSFWEISNQKKNYPVDTNPIQKIKATTSKPSLYLATWLISIWIPAQTFTRFLGTALQLKRAKKVKPNGFLGLWSSLIDLLCWYSGVLQNVYNKMLYLRFFVFNLAESTQVKWYYNVFVSILFSL